MTMHLLLVSRWEALGDILSYVVGFWFNLFSMCFAALVFSYILNYVGRLAFAF